MNFFIIIIGLIFFSYGCVQPKTERNVMFHMGPEEYSILQGHCEEMNLQGDILSLLQGIKLDVQEVLLLLKSPGKSTRIQLSNLAEQIEIKSFKIQSLSKVEWTTEKWNHEIVWKIDKEDFEMWAERFRGNFIVREAQIESIYFMGLKRDDLIEKVTIEYGDTGVLVKFKSLGSSLELCQLQKTLIIVSDIHFENARFKRHQLFSLNVRQLEEELHE
jgi:hypothetical protein